MFCISSCTPGSDDSLATADALMETNPDSALFLLTDIDVYRLSEKDRPYYALLLTQANIKNGVDVDSDSLIAVAYQKYSQEKNDDKKIRSIFYYGMIKYNQGLFYEATKYALAAFDLSKNMDNPYWIAKSAELISDIFFHSYNYSEAKSFTQIAVHNFRKSGRLSNLNYSLCDLARMDLNLDRNEEAYSLLDSLWNAVSTAQNPDENLMIYIRMPLINAKINTERFDEISDDDISFLDGLKDELGGADAIILKSRIKCHNEPNILHEEIGEYMHSDMTLASKIYLRYNAYLNAKASGNYKVALDIVDSLLYYENQAAEKVLQESAVSAQRDYYSNEASENERKSRMLTIVLTSAFVVFAIICLFGLWIYRIKSKHHKKELENSISSILELKSEADELRKNNIQLQQEVVVMDSTMESLSSAMKRQLDIESENAAVVERLFKEKWTTLNMLCNEYFNIGDTDASKKSVLNNIDKELKKLRSKKSLKEIEEAVDLYMGGAVSILRKECPFLKESDMAFLTLVLAGFSARAICIFTDVSYKFFYVKKTRLITRISQADFPSKSDILHKLQFS